MSQSITWRVQCGVAILECQAFLDLVNGEVILFGEDCTNDWKIASSDTSSRILLKLNECFRKRSVNDKGLWNSKDEISSFAVS